jgi:hypothetical protein
VPLLYSGVDLANPNLDLWFGAAILALAGFVVLVFWLLHKVHVDVADDPVHLATERITHRRRAIPIEVSEGQRCPGCHGDLAHEEGLHRCHECSTILHWECYREMGCPTMGCAGAFPRREDNAQAIQESGKTDDDPPVKVNV